MAVGIDFHASRMVYSEEAYLVDIVELFLRFD
jgi:hypothetical protein